MSSIATSTKIISEKSIAQLSYQVLGQLLRNLFATELGLWLPFLIDTSIAKYIEGMEREK